MVAFWPHTYMKFSFMTEENAGIELDKNMAVSDF